MMGVNILFHILYIILGYVMAWHVMLCWVWIIVVVVVDTYLPIVCLECLDLVLDGVQGCDDEYVPILAATSGHTT